MKRFLRTLFSCMAILLSLLFPVAFPGSAAAQTPVTAPEEPTLQGRSVSRLEAMLLDSDPKQRLAAVVALRDAGISALPVFVWAFNDEDPNVRMAAVKSIGPFGAASQPAVPSLADLLLVDPIPAVKTQIVHTLGQIGPYATDAVPALRRLQREADLTLRVNATQALDRILVGQRP